MNREILFRGKRFDNGEWVYGLFCECPCDDGTDIPSIMRIESKGNYRAFMQYPIISETRGQYTGLTDRNGVKIFEGDILDLTYYMVTDVGVVKFGEYKDIDMGNDYPCGHVGFYVDVENQRISVRKDILFFVSECKVIGNIHDDPGLMRGEENA